jgi:hypothetical protein
MSQGWTVFSAKWYRESLAALPATQEVQQILLSIVRRLELSPTNFPCVVEGTKIRLLKTRGHQVGVRIFPPLRVFYYIDGSLVIMLWAEQYDEMDADSEKERAARLELEH